MFTGTGEHGMREPKGVSGPAMRTEDKDTWMKCYDMLFIASFRMFVAMTIHEASRQLRFQLYHLYDEREATNITDLVMEHLTGWKRIDRIVNKTVPFTAAQEQLLHEYTRALLANKPLQYVLHEAWFYGMQLYVDEHVLIPRPETEELVAWLVTDANDGKSGIENWELLDIGTGSGCIPLAIKKKPTGRSCTCL